MALTTRRESLSDEVRQPLLAFRGEMTGRLSEAFALGRTDGTIADVSNPGDEVSAAPAVLEGAQLAGRAAECVEVFDRAVRALRRKCRAG